MTSPRHVPNRRSGPTLAAAMLSCAIAATTAHAQHPGPSSHGAPAGHGAATDAAQPQGPFSVRAYGVFRDMVQKQDYRLRVNLGAAKMDGATVAVGALSGLRGEITMLDGRYVVSYGGGCSACPPPHQETATLLATGQVGRWAEPIALPENLTGKALDHFIIEGAKAAGLDTGKPFPVRLKGMLTGVTMHVLTAPDPRFTGHGSAHPMAVQDEIKTSAIAGEVIGFYAPPMLAGVISHPGEPFHFHWIDETQTKTAHIDAFGMAKGAMLMLPRHP